MGLTLCELTRTGNAFFGGCYTVENNAFFCKKLFFVRLQDGTGSAGLGLGRIKSLGPKQRFFYCLLAALYTLGYRVLLAGNRDFSLSCLGFGLRRTDHSLES